MTSLHIATMDQLSANFMATAIRGHEHKTRKSRKSWVEHAVPTNRPSNSSLPSVDDDMPPERVSSFRSFDVHSFSELHDHSSQYSSGPPRSRTDPFFIPDTKRNSIRTLQTHDSTITPSASTVQHEYSSDEDEGMEDGIQIPGRKQGDKISVAEITRILMESVPQENLKHKAKLYKNCFRGCDGVSALMRRFPSLHTREQAIEFGRVLQFRQILDHVHSDHEFADSKHFYRLQPFRTPNILNTFRVWTEPVGRDPLTIVLRLMDQVRGIEAQHTTENGEIDYAAAVNDPRYFDFDMGTCELQGASIIDNGLDQKKLKAFWINLYNLLLKHAFLKVGLPSDDMPGSAFFNEVSYDVGGITLSLTDIESGILRCNAKPPSQRHAPFKAGDDDRLHLELDRVDCRIHFALRTSARTRISSSSVEDRLGSLAQLFCEDDDNIMINEDKSEMKLTSLFNWYKEDFAGSGCHKAQLPQAILPYLTGPKKEKLQKMLHCNRKIKVSFTKYRWLPNAINFRRFDKSSMKTMEISVLRGGLLLH